MSDDVSLNKAAIVKRCIQRIREEYALDPTLENYTHVDALTLNIERACQAAIDLAMHIAASQKLGVPQTSAEAFQLLAESSLVSRKTVREMISMTGFRNIAVHAYQRLDMSILRAVAETHYTSFIRFFAELGLDVE